MTEGRAFKAFNNGIVYDDGSRGGVRECTDKRHQESEGNFFGFQVSGHDGGPTLLNIKEIGPDWITGGTFGPEGGFICTLIILVGIAIILFLNNCSSKEKSWVINSIKNHNKDKKRVKEVISFVKDHNGLLYAEQKMEQFQQEALLLLNNYPKSEFKDALILMVNYVIERKK